MKFRNFSFSGVLSVFVVAAAMSLSFAPRTSGAEDGVEALTRGPVHEAFAEVVSFEPQAGFIVSTAPPELIEELPPDQRPEGENVEWISGYWAWDEDWNDFLWVSGVWRNLPPGRQWVPGYWNPLGGGRHQWVSGYWEDLTTTEVAYLPAPPPESVDAGPNVAAPSADHTWVPGVWVWTTTRYAWRPGYWLALRPDWTWVPSRYCWTPRGYIYIDGYWDYAVVRRGILFAPVHFHRPIYVTPGYCYRPSIVVGLGVFSHHLFVRPASRHYYFGDYYAARYRSAGFHASFAWHAQRHCYEPIHAHHRWSHRHDRGWERRLHDDFNFFRDNERARPPHTWAAMRNFRDDRFNDGRNRRFATSFADFARSPERGQKFVPLGRDSRERIAAQRLEMRNFGSQRREIESRRVAPREGDRPAMVRESLRRSPLAGRQVERLARNEAPPQRPEARPNLRPQPPTGRDQARPVPPGATREGAVPRPGDRQVRPQPERPQQADRGNPGRGTTRETPGRRPEITPHQPSRPEVRPAPPRRPEAAPQRPIPQRPQVTPPQRPAQPQTRPTPERRPQAAPPRQTPSQPQVRPAPAPRPQAAPPRPAPPRPQVRPQPQPRPQAAPPRQAPQPPQVRPAPQPRPQAAPQRQAPPRPQVRPAPQPRPQAAPQRQAPPRPQTRPTPPPRPQAAPQRQAQPRPTPQARPDSGQRERRGRER